MTIEVVYYNEGEDPAEWLPALRQALPEANIRLWKEGDVAPADYALVWNAPKALFEGRRGLKAVFNLAAGVDALLASEVVPENVPIFRLEDAGMAVQIAEYAVYAVLRYFRRLDEYSKLQAEGQWGFLTPNDRNHFTIGIMGLGVMGTKAAAMLKPFGFPLKGWSRNRKTVPGVICYAGFEELPSFLSDVNVLVCLLPNTSETAGILNTDLFRMLPDGAAIVNLGRGALMNEDDLLDALASRKLHGATLDVVANEPLSHGHPFWQHPNVMLTPHIAGLTFCDETVAVVAQAVRCLERGEVPPGLVNRTKGY